jgi:transketolase
MRRIFGKTIDEIAKKDKKVMLLVGDIGYGIFDDFRKNHPKRFINMGICEQSLISVAAGMSLEGLKPWVYTITPFLIERPFEQIKLDINQQKANVKLVGFADYPTLGPTHSELNARYMMKLFKNVKSFFPSNSNQTKKFTLKCSKINGPTFISLKTDKLINNW